MSCESSGPGPNSIHPSKAWVDIEPGLGRMDPNELIIYQRVIGVKIEPPPPGEMVLCCPETGWPINKPKEKPPTLAELGISRPPMTRLAKLWSRMKTATTEYINDRCEEAYLLMCSMLAELLRPCIEARLRELSAHDTPGSSLMLVPPSELSEESSALPDASGHP